MRPSGPPMDRHSRPLRRSQPARSDAPQWASRNGTPLGVLFGLPPGFMGEITVVDRLPNESCCMAAPEWGARMPFTVGVYCRGSASGID